MLIKKYFKYFWYIAKHKYFIGIELARRGYFVRAMFHDWDKFLPDRFFVCARAFEKEKRLKGKDEEKYCLAVFKHKRRSKHHFEYWSMQILPYFSGNYIAQTATFNIPKKYLIEMVLDWETAAKVQGNIDPIVWWRKNSPHMLIHCESKKWIDKWMKKY